MTERARLLGLPVAAFGETPAEPPRVNPFWAAAMPRSPSGLLVADLSAMWAGPLCGQLLAKAGAIVVKVETAARPDGARAGAPEFFDWMNGGKLSYLADSDEPSGVQALLAAADVVIESSRPAALTRRGLGPTTVAPRDGRSGYGSPVTAPRGSAPTGWRSATMPRCPVGWSAAATTPRVSAVTPSPPLDGASGGGGGRAIVAQRWR